LLRRTTPTIVRDQMHVITGASRMPREREQELVEDARHGAAAFGELYDFYLPRIYGFVYRRVQERSVAEDLTAATFHKALEAIRTRRFRNDAFGGWLYRVAANAVVDHFRQSARTVPMELPPDPAADALGAALDRDELRRAMARIGQQHREVLVLRFFDDLDPDEASVVLGCTRATFAVKLHRALSALRGAMTQEATDAV
jgi:RNA polymerase sigma-70 factor, ECF subfamily